jgi:hypothetical protein
MPKTDRFFWLRLSLLLALGAGAILAAALYTRGGRREPAPEAVQREGLRLVEDILERVADTEFGRSERGRRLAEAIRTFLRQGRVVFTAEIPSQALYRREPNGEQFLYVRVLRLGGRLVQQTREEVAEGLFHEAVHACCAEVPTSIEEECDGFAAGLCGAAADRGRPPPELLTIEGQSVAEFVLQQYPALPRRPDYEPVGESRAWLIRRTGLPPTRDN